MFLPVCFLLRSHRSSFGFFRKYSSFVGPRGSEVHYSGCFLFFWCFLPRGGAGVGVGSVLFLHASGGVGSSSGDGGCLHQLCGLVIAASLRTPSLPPSPSPSPSLPPLPSPPGCAWGVGGFGLYIAVRGFLFFYNLYLALCSLC